MTDFLLGGGVEVPEGESGEFLDIGVVDGQVAEVHQEEIDHFLVVDVVPAHLVEGVLRLQDVVAQVQDHEALTYHLHDIDL